MFRLISVFFNAGISRHFCFCFRYDALGHTANSEGRSLSDDAYEDGLVGELLWRTTVFSNEQMNQQTNGKTIQCS